MSARIFAPSSNGAIAMPNSELAQPIKPDESMRLRDRSISTSSREGEGVAENPADFPEGLTERQQVALLLRLSEEGTTDRIEGDVNSPKVAPSPVQKGRKDTAKRTPPPPLAATPKLYRSWAPARKRLYQLSVLEGIAALRMRFPADEMDVVSGPFTTEEDAQLRAAIKEHVEKGGSCEMDWATIAAHVPSRAGYQCRNRALALRLLDELPQKSAAVPVARKSRSTQKRARSSDTVSTQLARRRKSSRAAPAPVSAPAPAAPLSPTRSSVAVSPPPRASPAPRVSSRRIVESTPVKKHEKCPPRQEEDAVPVSASPTATPQPHTPSESPVSASPRATRSQQLVPAACIPPTVAPYVTVVGDGALERPDMGAALCEPGLHGVLRCGTTEEFDGKARAQLERLQLVFRLDHFRWYEALCQAYTRLAARAKMLGDTVDEIVWRRQVVDLLACFQESLVNIDSAHRFQSVSLRRQHFDIGRRLRPTLQQEEVPFAYLPPPFRMNPF